MDVVLICAQERMRGVLMSATRDRSQKIKLVVSNGSPIHHEPVSSLKLNLSLGTGQTLVKNHQSHVIKAEDLKKHQISAYEDQKLSQELRASSPQDQFVNHLVQSPQGTLEGLKQNLKTLNELHSRLRFMLKELEELVID